MKIVLLIAVLLFVTGCVKAETKHDDFVAERMAKAGKPGLASVVISKGKIKSENYFGYADLTKNKKVDADTIFNIGSVSKTFTAVAVMQLADQGKINLDEDINKYIDFKVQNPYYIDSKITVRMLLTHVSTITNNWMWVMQGMLKEGDPEITLAEFVKGYLSEDGKYYHKNNFLKKMPGENYFSYSNPAICLAAYIVEKISGEEIEEYCKTNIFTPLNMNNTSFFYKNLDMQNVAVPYEKALWFYKKKELYSAPFYPAGFAKSTARDMGQFLIMIENKGEYNGKRILSERSYAEMTAINKNVSPDEWEDQAVVFQYKDVAGKRFIGHTGGLYGISAMMYCNMEDEKGVILLMNGSWKNMFDGNRMNEKEIREIFFHLYENE